MTGYRLVPYRFLPGPSDVPERQLRTSYDSSVRLQTSLPIQVVFPLASRARQPLAYIGIVIQTADPRSLAV